MNEKGQSLIEVMVALGVAVIIVTAIVLSVIVAVANSQLSKAQNLATHYARQGIEVFRQLSRSDWNELSSYSGSYCLKENTTSLSETEDRKTEIVCGPMSETVNLRREVEIFQNSDDCVLESDVTNQTRGTKVIVKVYWNDGRCGSQDSFCHEVRLDSCFQDINILPTP